MTTLITKIELWPVDRNARTHSDEQIEQITHSIQEFGFTNPILVDTAAGILAGHARLRGALRAGLPQGAWRGCLRSIRCTSLSPLVVGRSSRKQAIRAADRITFDEIAAGGTG